MTELKSCGYEVCENTVAKPMAENGMAAEGAPPKTTIADPRAKYSQNLIKGKIHSKFGEPPISDITYIRTKEGWLYLAVVIDIYSRTALGWPVTRRTNQNTEG